MAPSLAYTEFFTFYELPVFVNVLLCVESGSLGCARVCVEEGGATVKGQRQNKKTLKSNFQWHFVCVCVFFYYIIQ